MGTERGKCFADDTCHDGLACSDELCVASASDKTSSDINVHDAEGAALELLLKWREAQNSGNFDRYASLYASEFTGVKRVGNRSSDFNRDSWLADRRRMFRKPMSVATENTTFDADASSVTVEFEQTWKQGTFEDRGRKRIEVRNDGERWQIVREEMLDSNVTPVPKFVRTLERVAQRACACSSEACGAAELRAYSRWLERLDPLALNDLDLAAKSLVSDAAQTAVRCAARLTDFGDVTTPPDPARCRAWFDRPDKWDCMDCTGYCEGNF